MMTTWISLHKERIILNVGLVFYLILMICNLPFSANDHVMFLTQDSTEYLATGKEFFNFAQTGFSETRPFLFSVFVSVFHFIGGATLLWILQLVFWILSANLLYTSLKLFTGKFVWALVALFIFCANISLIALTYHALTEVSTVLILTLLIYTLVRNKKALFKQNVFFKILALLVILTLVKPLFFLPLIGFLLISPFIYLNEFKRRPKGLYTAILILAPLLMQMTVMKIKYDHFTVSRISELTLRRYFVAQHIEYAQEITREEAIPIAEQMSTHELMRYFSANRSKFWRLFNENIKFNVNAYPSYLALEEKMTHKGFFNFMESTNHWYYDIYRYSRIFFFLFVVYALFWRKLVDNLPIIFLGFLSYYIIWTSGISFYQGDRLVIASLPLWIFTDLVLLQLLLRALSKPTKIFKRKTAS